MASGLAVVAYRHAAAAELITSGVDGVTLPPGIDYLIQYSLTALVAIAVYRLIKTRLCRERPFITFHRRIACGEPARDRYSFPSGHTMHAVMFCILVANHTFWLFPLLIPLAVLIALSRVGLGLHYISDVLAGAALGVGFAYLSLRLVG